VIEFSTDKLTQLFPCSNGENFAIQYLEFCVRRLQNEDPAIHNLLLSLYAKQVRFLLSKTSFPKTAFVRNTVLYPSEPIFDSIHRFVALDCLFFIGRSRHPIFRKGIWKRFGIL
jgi:hypothetical protein